MLPHFGLLSSQRMAEIQWVRKTQPTCPENPKCMPADTSKQSPGPDGLDPTVVTVFKGHDSALLARRSHGRPLDRTCCCQHSHPIATRQQLSTQQALP
jgi:hypothetical protein